MYKLLVLPLADQVSQSFPQTMYTHSAWMKQVGYESAPDRSVIDISQLALIHDF